MGLKIFLSYGHDANTELVLRIKRDLEAAGYAPWIDTSEIRSGDDWRRKILDGSERHRLDAGFPLAPRGPRKRRVPGRNRAGDGRAVRRAGHHTGRAGARGAATGLDRAHPVARHVGLGRRKAGDAAAWEAWYRDRLDAILNLLADPETHRFTGEIEELERRLKPIIQAADIPPLIDGFVGREWVVATVEAWRRTQPQRRVFWLTGGPGAGKSAFAAWMTHYQRTNVVGLNLCRWNDEDRHDPRRVLRTLGFLIAARLPDYRRRLLDKLRMHDPDGSELARKGAAAMFNWLLAEPLFLIDGGRRGDRYVLVIDALDETLRDGVSELADLLAELAPKLPAWMAVVVTSRPEFPIAASFSHVAPLRLDAEGSAANAGDLRDFARQLAGDAGTASRGGRGAGGSRRCCRLRQLHVFAQAARCGGRNSASISTRPACRRA